MASLAIAKLGFLEISKKMYARIPPWEPNAVQGTKGTVNCRNPSDFEHKKRRSKERLFLQIYELAYQGVRWESRT